MQCKYCLEEVDKTGVHVSTGELDFPTAHRRCYEMAHPPKFAKTVHDVLSGPEPQLGREVVEWCLTPDYEASENIVTEYNNRLTALHKRRIKP